MIVVNESNNIKKGDYVVYKWNHGRKDDPYYLNWVRVNTVKNSGAYDLVGWWNGETLNPNLTTKNVIYVGKSKEDVENYIKNHSNNGKVIQESVTSFKKGDKVNFIIPDTIDQTLDGVIDHKASTKEINDAGWDNCTEKDNFYVINTTYRGKSTKVVSPAYGIKSLGEGLHTDDVKKYINTSIRMLGELSVKLSNAQEQRDINDIASVSKIRNTIDDLQKLLNNIKYS